LKKIKDEFKFSNKIIQDIKSSIKGNYLDMLFVT